MKKQSVSLPATYTPDDPLDLAGKQPLFEAMDTEWGNLDDAQQRQTIVNAFRATMLSPRMNLKSNAILYQSIMNIPANESDPMVFENAVRELKKKWDAQGQMGLEQSPEDVLAVDEILPGKFLPGFGGNLRRLSNLGPYADELTRLANEDMANGGSGDIFRQGVLDLQIPGVGPKVASFAWLALAPMTSELATIDVHMMRYLGEGDDSPKNDTEYLALEDRLRAERDEVYPNVPLTQYQGGVWDKQRTPGYHQDHSPLRAHEPVPFRDINGATPARPLRPPKEKIEDPGQLTLGKVATLFNHIGSWIYFEDTNELYLGFTHTTIMRKLTDEGSGEQALKHFEERPMVVGQLGSSGNIQVMTDGTELEDLTGDGFNAQDTTDIESMIQQIIASMPEGDRTQLEELKEQLWMRTIFNVKGEAITKTSGNLTNSFVYLDGKLVVENRPHPQIVRDHFPPDAYLDDMQAGLIFEEDGKIYPVFHSYTLTSQEHKREALMALETYYHRPIEEELDYGEAMDRLDKEAGIRFTAKVEFVDHEHDDTWGENSSGIWAMVYVPKSNTVYVGTEGSSHGALMKAVPELKAELKRYDNDTFQNYTNVGYYHRRWFDGASEIEWLTGAVMSPQLEDEVVEAFKNRRVSVAFTSENPLGGFHSFFFIDGYLYMGEKPYENHGDLAIEHNLTYEDFAEKSGVAGVIGPQDEDYGDIQFYSDYLAELGDRDEYSVPDDEEYEDLNERNRTEGRMAVRALTEVYNGIEQKYQGDIKLTVHGGPIEEWLPSGVVKETAVGVPEKFRDWPSPIRYITTKDGTIYTDADSPRPSHYGIILDNKLDPNDVVDAGHYEMDGTPVSLGNGEMGNGQMGSDQYKKLWNISSTMAVTFVPAGSDGYMESGVSYGYDTATDHLYWTDGHHPDIYRAVANPEDGSYPPLDNFIGGFYYEGEEGLDQGSGNMTFEKVPLDPAKQQEIITTLQGVLDEYRAKLDEPAEPINLHNGGLSNDDRELKGKPGEPHESAEILPKVVWVSYPYTEDEDEGPDLHGHGLPFSYFPQVDTIVIADEEVFHIEMFDGMDQNALGVRAPSMEQYRMMAGDMIPGRVDANGDVGFYKPPGENQMRIAEALKAEWPRIASDLVYSDEYGGLGRPEPTADTGQQYDESTDPAYLVNIAKVAGVEWRTDHIAIVDTPYETHGSGSGYPFFYNIGEQTLYIANNESLHMELIANAGIDLTSEDYLYGEGGDAGGAKGFLAGRVGSEYGDGIFLFEGDSSLLSGEAQEFLEQVDDRGRVSKVAAVHTLFPDLDPKNITFLYDPGTNDLGLTNEDGYHIDILKAMGELNYSTDPDDSYQFRDDYVMGRDSKQGGFSFYSGGEEDKQKARMLLDSWQATQKTASPEDGQVVDIPDDQGNLRMRAGMADVATKTIYVAEYHIEIFQALGLQGMYDAGDEEALATHMVMGVFIPHWKFAVGNGEEFLDQGDERDIKYALKAFNQQQKTASEDELVWVDCDLMHELGLPVLYFNGVTYIGTEQGYHTNLFRDMMQTLDLKDIPSGVVASRIDVYGNVIRYDYDTEQNGMNENELEGYDEEITGPGEYDVDAMLQTLTNHGPEIYDRLVEINATDDLTKIGWPNVTNVAEMYEEHQQRLRDDPAMHTGRLVPDELHRIPKKSEADMQGAMLALRVPINIANALQIEGGEPAELMHITLAYFKDAAADRDDWQGAVEIAQQFDFNLSGLITGYGTFDNDEVVLWAQPEIPGLVEKREALVAALNEAGYTVDDSFPDFKPHITLAYDWKGDVPELEQPIPITFDGLYFYQGEKMKKVSMAPGILTGTVRFVQPGAANQHHYHYKTFTSQDEADRGVEWGHNRGPEYEAVVMNEMHASIKVSMEIVRIHDNDEYPNEAIGFEKGARAFAYDPTTGTVYTHPGHHPDIVKYLYNIEDLYDGSSGDAFLQAAKDYLGGGSNGPKCFNPNKIGAWSGNVSGNAPIPDALLVEIGQKIGNSSEIPQIQDAGGWSAAGRDPVVGNITVIPADIGGPEFSMGSLAFAYDAADDTLYGTNGHHPDIYAQMIKDGYEPVSGDKWQNMKPDMMLELRKTFENVMFGGFDPRYHKPIDGASGNMGNDKSVDLSDEKKEEILRTLHNVADSRRTSAFDEDPRFKRIFSDHKYNPMDDGFGKAILTKGYNGDSVVWGITDRYGSPHHAEAMEGDGEPESNGDGGGAMGGQYDKGKALMDPGTMSGLGPEPQIAQLVQRELDQKLGPKKWDKTKKLPEPIMEALRADPWKDYP